MILRAGAPKRTHMPLPGERPTAMSRRVRGLFRGRSQVGAVLTCRFGRAHEEGPRGNAPNAYLWATDFVLRCVPDPLSSVSLPT